MAWRLVDVDEERVRFVVAASRGDRTMSALCAEFGISRPTGYLWLKRYQSSGVAGVQVRSRRPHVSPDRIAATIEQRIVTLRQMHPDWGARKLAVLLEREGCRVPATTVHRVLLRQHLVREEDRHRPALKRFEREQPNQLWQMDFKSQKGWNRPVGPLSVIDDASRYVIALEGIWTTCGEAVQDRLQAAFIECGMPDAMLMDHGVPWWNKNSAGGWTRFSVWLMKHGSNCFSPVSAILRLKVKSSGSTVLWKQPAGAACPNPLCISAGWTTSARSTTTCVPMKR